MSEAKSKEFGQVLCTHRPHVDEYYRVRRFRILFHDAHTLGILDQNKLSDTEREQKSTELLLRVLGVVSEEETLRMANAYFPLAAPKKLLYKAILHLEKETYGKFARCGLMVHPKQPWLAVSTHGQLMLSDNSNAKQVFQRSKLTDRLSVLFQIDTASNQAIEDSDMERIKRNKEMAIQYLLLVTQTPICLVVLVRPDHVRMVTVKSQPEIASKVTDMIQKWKTEWLEWKWSAKGNEASKAKCVKALANSTSIENPAEWLIDTRPTVSDPPITYDPRVKPEANKDDEEKESQDEEQSKKKDEQDDKSKKNKKDESDKSKKRDKEEQEKEEKKEEKKTRTDKKKKKKDEDVSDEEKEEKVKSKPKKADMSADEEEEQDKGKATMSDDENREEKKKKKQQRDPSPEKNKQSKMDTDSDSDDESSKSKKQIKTDSDSDTESSKKKKQKKAADSDSDSDGPKVSKKRQRSASPRQVKHVKKEQEKKKHDSDSDSESDSKPKHKKLKRKASSDSDDDDDKRKSSPVRRKSGDDSD